MTPQIPVVEVADLLDQAGAERAAAALERGLGTFGLVYVRGHEISRAEVLGLYDRFLQVLGRPTEEKRSWGGPELWYQRGWTPPNTEQAVVADGEPDFKECFFAAPMPLDPLCKQWYPRVYADNVWPNDAPAFRSELLGVGHKLHRLGLLLLGACERALELEPGAITHKATGGAHVTRLLKYLPLPADRAGSGVLWGEEHTDFNVLTLLPGGCFYRDGAPGRPTRQGGLSLRTRPTPEHPRGLQVPGTPPEGCVVAQVGQQLEVLTGGRYLATPHGIAAPDEPGWMRTSIAHFVHLNGRATVEPLPPFRDAAGDAYAPPVLAGTYACKTLVDIGLAPAEALDGLGYRHYGRLADWRAAEDG